MYGEALLTALPVIFMTEIVMFQKNLKMKIWCIRLMKKPTRRGEGALICGGRRINASAVFADLNSGVEVGG